MTDDGFEAIFDRIEISTASIEQKQRARDLRRDITNQHQRSPEEIAGKTETMRDANDMLEADLNRRANLRIV